jgi:alpha-ketoglutaric semialdehyde dehydrogenase
MQATGLLLVDLQEDFLCHPELVPGRFELVGAVSGLLAWARAQCIPVFHVHTRVQADGSDAMPHWQAKDYIPCSIGSEGARPPPDLQPAPGEAVFYKRFFDPFEDPALSLELRQKHIHRLLVAGVHTHACVRQAVLGAYARGVEVLLVTDAVASYDPAHAQHTMNWLVGRAASAVTTRTLISGPEQGGQGDGELVIHDPCDGQVLFSLAAARLPEVNAALAALMVAQRSAQQQPAASAELLRKWHDLLLEERSDVIVLLVSDLGKPVADARAEFDYGLALLQSAIGHCASALEAGFPRVHYRPLGVVGVITPWNNPFALAIGKIAPALGFGNAVAWKPAPAAWRISLKLRDTLDAAGLGQYLALLPGGGEVGELLVAHPALSAVTFTGSAEVGKRIAQVCDRLGKRFQGELGASNAALVLHDADLDLAANDLAAAMFSFAGQRCTAIRRIIVERDVLDDFRQRLALAVAALRVGNPHDPAIQVGPVISLPARNRLSSAIARALADGARMIAQASLDEHIAPQGAWLAPTVLEQVRMDGPMWCDEQFGPVAVLQGCDDFEEAIALHNSVRYGLLGVVYTQSPERAEEFVSKAEAGLCSINQARPPFSAQGPFVGWKDSGRGVPEHGRWNREFYTQVQAVYDDGPW